MNKEVEEGERKEEEREGAVEEEGKEGKWRNIRVKK